jgi:hypothetical protein
MFSFLSRGENLNTAYPNTKQVIPQPYLGYHSNNKYDNFPPLMKDGRSITASWQPEAVLNNKIIQDNNIKSNWQYRKFLTNNAVKIIKHNTIDSLNDVGYYKRHTDAPEHSKVNTPYLYQSYLDTTKPIGYVDTDLKQNYLTREQLNSRKVSPAITQEQLLANQRRSGH